MWKRSTRGVAARALALTLCCAAAAGAQEARDLVVAAGRPLRVALDTRVRVKRVGQPVTATLVEPVYAYDRIVVPSGAKLFGRIESLERVSSGARFRGFLLRGDLSPARPVRLTFERLVLPDGQEMKLATRVGPGTADVVLQAADEPRRPGIAARAKDEVKRKANEARQQAKDVVATVKRPGKLRRLKQALLASLPFHAQYIPEATVYDAELLEALDFGSVTAADAAPEGTSAPPESILNARLVRALDSATTPRGTSIEAVLTRPLFSADNQLILPEGAQLSGEVTYAKPASHFRHNGQLRLLFEAVRVKDHDAEPLRASLQSAEVGRNARLAIDEEGGASATNSKTRFLAPVLSAGALGASLAQESVYDPGEPEFASGAVEAGSSGTALGGFSGLGVLGMGLSQLSRPAGVALGFVGLARSLYGSLIAKGKEVSFPAGTRIQVKLAPGPSPAN
jgi:hypothetical protein